MIEHYKGIRNQLPGTVTNSHRDINLIDDNLLRDKSEAVNVPLILE